MKGKFSLLAIFFQGVSLWAVTATWSNTSGGNWTEAGNWSGGVPSLAGDTAIFGSAITSNQTITLNASEIVGTVKFDNTNSYLISPSTTETLTLNNSGSGAAITITNANGNGAHTIAARITLADALTITQGSSGNFTLSQVISESGSRALTKAGTGVLVLDSSSNTYTGGTTLSAGTLQIADDGSLGTSGDLTMSGGATLRAGTTGIDITARNVVLSGNGTVDTNGFNMTISGDVQGSAKLTKSGNGTLILSGTNSGQSWSTEVAGGTLSVASQGNLGTGTVTLDDNGTLQITGAVTVSRTLSLAGAGTIDPQGNAVTLSGQITGSGSLTKISSGTVTLSNGTNDYSGGTTISAGTLSVSSDANLGNSSGTLAIGAGTLTATSVFSSSRAVSLTGAATINTGADLTLSGAVTGSGSLTKTGASTLILTGTNDYSGGTTISAGTLQGNSNSLQGTINNGSTLVFDQTFDGTYSGELQGAGGMTKQGSGILTVTGTSTSFTGTTTVTVGNLRVNGSLRNSPIDVIGATLSGSGTVGSVTSMGGTISPGSSIGTLTINGDLTLDNDSTTVIEISPLAADRIDVSGTATLDGTLSIQPLSGFYGLDVSYTILTAGSVMSDFDTVSSTNSNFIPTATPTATTVQLDVEIVRPFLDFPFSNANTRSVGENIDALAVGGTLRPDADFVAVLNSLVGAGFDTINEALDQMQPSQVSAFAELQSAVGGQILSLYHQRPLLSCGCFGGPRFWVHPFGNWLRQGAQDMQVGFQATTYGVAAGFSVELLEDWVMGVGAVWDDTHLDWHKDRGHGDTMGVYGAFYTDFPIGDAYFGLSFLGGRDWVDISRHIHFTSVDRHATSNTKTLDLMGQFSAAYFFGAPTCHLFPYANVDCLYLKMEGFTEKNAGALDLTVESYSSLTLKTEAGMGLEIIDKNYDETICISPLVAFGWTMQYPLSRDPFTSTFSGQPISFNTTGWDKTWQLLSVRFDLSIYYRCFTLSGEYVTELSPQGSDVYENQRANVRFDFQW